MRAYERLIKYARIHTASRDGAQLSFRGLLCPNLGTGGYAFHGPFEHICAEDMDRAVEIILNIVSGNLR